MIYQLFLTQVKSNPHASAIVTSTGNVYTYFAANNKINQLANYFVSQGIKSRDRVAVLLNDEDLHIFIFLALERINATYVPLDTEISERQLRIDTDLLGLKKYIIDRVMSDDFKIDQSKTLYISTEALKDIDSCDMGTPARKYNTKKFEKITYIVSSSGSTGSKKWIPILGDGLIYWSTIIKRKLKLKSSDKILATRSPAYDARIFEYVCAFSGGGELHLLNKTQRKDLSAIETVCQNASISCLLLIASQLSIENSEELVAKLHSSGLKHLMVTGDACSPHLKQVCERLDLKLWNAYGPTEATFGLSIVCVNNITVNDTQGRAIVPIAKPYGREVRYHIINDILHIQSPYLSPGYISHEKSDSSFKVMKIHGQKIRLFNTGDSFSKKSGFIFYQGRAAFDSHCKVSGVKISPSYIEHCIKSYNLENSSACLQVSVVIKKYLGREKPFAYMVTNKAFDKTAFANFLKQVFRKEEIPVVIRKDELPRLFPSQKIDMQALINTQDALNDFFFNETADITETTIDTSHHDVIKKIWCNIFRQDEIPSDIEFTYLGGDSMQLLLMSIQIKKQLDKNYKYGTLLGLSKITINTVAASLSSKPTPYDTLALIYPIELNVSRQSNVFFLPALLGEGYFSYKNLAKVMSGQLDKNIYGLSDPGIIDEKWLPVSMIDAVKRYINAIKSIQNTGPYELLGFSIGSTLAFEVAQELHKQGETISAIHLVDGFPPYFYQTLSTDAYADLLQTVLNFISMTLKHEFDDETLEPIAPRIFASLDKQQQIESGFKAFEERLKSSESKKMLSMAKCHLTLMLTTPKPQNKLNLCPTLYLSKKDQPYFDAFERVGLDKTSSDYHYLLWNHYFSKITRFGTRFSVDHLSVLGLEEYSFKQSCHTFRDSKTPTLFNKIGCDVKPCHPQTENTLTYSP